MSLLRVPLLSHSGRLPPIEALDVKRLPRERSGGKDRDSGRVLIALSHPRNRDILLVRNCYISQWTTNGKRKEAMNIQVENMGAHATRSQLREAALAHLTTSTSKKMMRSLHVLKWSGFAVDQAPFRLVDPAPEYMADMLRPEWNIAFRAAQDPDLRKQEFATPRNDGKTSGAAYTDPQAVAIAEKRKADGTYAPWTPERLHALAVALRMTDEECAKLVEMSPVIYRRFIRGIEIIQHKAVLLLLHQAEQMAKAMRFQ